MQKYAEVTSTYYIFSLFILTSAAHIMPNCSLDCMYVCVCTHMHVSICLLCVCVCLYTCEED